MRESGRSELLLIASVGSPIRLSFAPAVSLDLLLQLSYNALGLTSDLTSIADDRAESTHDRGGDQPGTPSPRRRPRLRLRVPARMICAR